MNKISTLFFILLAVFAASCSKDDDAITPVRDRSVQNVRDMDSIEKYLDTHYILVDENYNVTMDTLRAGDGNVSIRNQTQYPLQFKMVNLVTDATTKTSIDYKVYYLKFREGENQRPSTVDSVYVNYKGTLINQTRFDSAENPIWLTLDGVVKGWPGIFTLFKTGTYDESTPVNDPASFTGYGAGIMFLPSGLGYFNQNQSGIPAYSPIIFSFKLFSLRYRDHDRDGILSKDEVAVPGDDPLKYDSDGDEIPNMYDADDDGDGYLTFNEIRDADENIIFPYPTCAGGTIPKYLDPTCH